MLPYNQKHSSLNVGVFFVTCEQTLTVADTGFPRGGGASPPEGRQPTILSKFPPNCMKLKEFGGGARSKILLSRSATA